MKVKVSYTVDYEEVPGLVRDLINDCQRTLRDASTFSFEIVQYEESVAAVKDLQEKLATVSDKLEDCISLSRGYLTLMTKPENQQAAAPAPTGEENEQSE